MLGLEFRQFLTSYVSVAYDGLVMLDACRITESLNVFFSGFCLRKLDRLDNLG